MAATRTAPGTPAPTRKIVPSAGYLQPPTGRRLQLPGGPQHHTRTNQCIGHDFGRIAIHRQPKTYIQTKLVVNEPGDAYEQEADSLAERVLRMPAPSSEGTRLRSTRRPKKEERDSKTNPLMAAIIPLAQGASYDSAGGSAPCAGFESRLPVSGGGSPGSLLPASMRTFMEPRLGFDFSRVQLHKGGLPVGLTRSIRAQAFIYGNDINFREGRNDINSAAGKQLLAHELSHTIQQSAAGTPAPGGFVQRATGGAEDVDKPTQPETPAASTAQAAGQQPASQQATGTAPPKKLWYGLISPTFGGPLTFNPWSMNGVRAIAIFSPLFYAQGTVIVASSVHTDEYDLGFMQELTASQMAAEYADSGGRPYKTLTITQKSLPVRDSQKGSTPWMKQEDVKALSAPNGYIVNTQDRPRNTVPWQTPDKKGALKSSMGADVFCTWLVARHRPSGTLKYLNWALWSVDWGSTFDSAAQTGKSTGLGGSLHGTGEGEGSFTPLAGDPIANENIKLVWAEAASQP